MSSESLAHCAPGAARACLSNRPPIDLAHLARMTVGDRRLQREILDLFDEQIGRVVVQMYGAERNMLAALAHTLKGSARSIGAWELVHAAEAVERAVVDQRPLHELLASVARAGDVVRTAIAEMRTAEMRQNEADENPAL